VVTNKVSRLAVEQSRVVHRGFVTRSLPGQLTECEVLGNRTTRFRIIQGGSNMTGTDLCVNKPHCAAAVRP